MKLAIRITRNVLLSLAFVGSVTFGSFQAFAAKPAGLSEDLNFACTPCGGCGSRNGGILFDRSCFCCHEPAKASTTQ